MALENRLGYDVIIVKADNSEMELAATGAAAAVIKPSAATTVDGVNVWDVSTKPTVENMPAPSIGTTYLVSRDVYDVMSDSRTDLVYPRTVTPRPDGEGELSLVVVHGLEK